MKRKPKVKQAAKPEPKREETKPVVKPVVSSKTAPEKAASLPVGGSNKTFIRVQEGHQGYHAIIEGGHGLWAASKISAADAVLNATSKHLMLGALEEAEDKAKLCRIDIREVGEGLYMVETGTLDNPGMGVGRIQMEPRGQQVSEVLIDPKKVDRPIGRKIARAAMKLAACFTLV